MNKRTIVTLVVAAVVVVALAAVFTRPRAPGAPGPGGGTVTGVTADLAKIAQERGLNPMDMAAALKTYVPSGKYDEAVMFASGGHSGQVIAIGIPSMRILKNIGVFTPEPWQGWGYDDDSRAILAGGDVDGKPNLWGDTHHPNISETNGEYDGEYLFINDKVSARVAVIDLKDWATKQIIKNPLTYSNHGSAFVTPNTEYVIESGQYGLPWIGSQADITEYADKYRGSATMWKFDREKGRLDPSQSFAIELPPYWQDLCDAGKGPSDGLFFCNSINTELATGKVNPDDPYFEAGVSANDRDYLHVIDWKKAEQLFKAGKTTLINNFPVISLDTAIAEGILHFVPEPKSPHGSDVIPKGTHVVVGGKLDPHVSVYSVAKIKDAIQNQRFEGRDRYGVPIIAFEDALEAQVMLGMGPLHTVFDDQGYAYTSLFLDSAVARWSLGTERPQDGWKLIQKLDVQYNIGHLTALHGDTVNPGGKYLVALNKWAIDRFTSTGPLLPQNLQLVDISGAGETMQVLYDMPMGIGEPHYAQIISVDKLKSWDVYPQVGWDPGLQASSKFGTKPGEERIERNGNRVTVYMTSIRSHFTPEHVSVKKGDIVTFHVTNVETAKDATHGFALPAFNIGMSLEPGKTSSFTFTADTVGTYSWYCTEFCSALHLEMMGYLQVTE